MFVLIAMLPEVVTPTPTKCIPLNYTQNGYSFTSSRRPLPKTFINIQSLVPSNSFQKRMRSTLRCSNYTKFLAIEDLFAYSAKTGCSLFRVL